MAFFGLNGDLWCFFGVKRFCRFFFVFIWGFPIFELIFMEKEGFVGCFCWVKWGFMAFFWAKRFCMVFFVFVFIWGFPIFELIFMVFYGVFVGLNGDLCFFGGVKRFCMAFFLG